MKFLRTVSKNMPIPEFYRNNLKIHFIFKNLKPKTVERFL